MICNAKLSYMILKLLKISDIKRCIFNDILCYKRLHMTFKLILWHFFCDTNWKKRPIGHIAHLSKQFKLIYTYDYQTLIKRRKILVSSLLELNCSSFEPPPLLNEWCIVPSLVKISPVVLEKRIFLFRQCIFAISYLSPIAKGRYSSFEQTWIPFTKECCAEFGWI